MELVYHDLRRMDEVKAFIEEWENDSDYILCETSGSTGTPKQIALDKRMVKHSAERTIERFNLTAGMKAGLALSTTTIAGKLMVVRALLAQLELHVLPVTKNPLFGVKTCFDFIALVPTQAISIIENNPDSTKLTTVLIGAAPLTQSQHRKISAACKNAYHTYGMTETASHVAVRKITEENDTCYEALEGITFETEDSCLVIYSADFKQGIKTNDCVALHSNTSFTYIGRNDFAMNVGGNKVHPEEIEYLLRTYITCEFIVVPFDDETYGQGIGLMITGSFIPERLAMLDLPGLNTTNLPRKYLHRNELIYNANGKIDRLAMIEQSKQYAWKPIL